MRPSSTNARSHTNWTEIANRLVEAMDASLVTRPAASMAVLTHASTVATKCGAEVNLASATNTADISTRKHVPRLLAVTITKTNAVSVAMFDFKFLMTKSQGNIQGKSNLDFRAICT